MATTTTATISAPLSKYSYFALSDPANPNGGYSSSSSISQMYIGSSASSGTTAGKYVGVFGLSLYDLFGSAVAKAIQSITFKITTTNTSSGYNGCVARLEYIGTTYNSTTPLWRVGSSTETINLIEAATNTMTTIDATTCTNLQNVANSAASGEYHYFRIVRESGMGVWMSANSGVELSVEYIDSSATRTTVYVWGAPTQTYTYPETAMTSNSSANCVASASSVYGTNYAAWRAFNKSNSDHLSWASSITDPTPWLQLKMPRALADISVTLKNRTKTTNVSVNGPIAGNILGSNDGSTWTKIGGFNSFNGTASGALLGTINCENTVAYQYVRIEMIDWVSKDQSMSVGEMEVTGSITSSSGGWTKATPYIWGATTQTYTYPEKAMTSNSSSDCIASASTEYNASYAAWRAFNKSYSDAYGWAQKDADTSPWLQLQMPKALTNISIKIVNRTRSSNVNGPVDGYVQGSTNGTTWIPLKTFSGFDGNTSGGVAGIVSCDNSIAYNYVRVVFTKGVQDDFYGGCVGEMYITGTWTSPEGWIEATPYIYTSNN